MTEDWYTRPMRVEKGPEFPVLDPAKFYTLRLVDITFQANVTRTWKGESRTRDEITTVWEVEGTTARVWQRFSYSWNVKSNLVRFIIGMGHYLPEGAVGTLSSFFTLNPPARIRCRLTPQERDGQHTGYYSIDMNTLQPVTSVTPAQSPASTAQLSPDQEIERIVSFLMEGKFQQRDEAMNIAMKFLGVADPSRFAAAWARYQKQSDAVKTPGVIIGS